MIAPGEKSYKLREAAVADVDPIVRLVNNAFEVERFFKNEERTDPEQIRQMMSEGMFWLLEEGGDLVASIFVKVTGERVYIGLLSVDPGRQNTGFGRRMMAEAEQHARTAGCRFADIRVVNLRTELVPLYQKLGYAESGLEEISADITQKFSRPVHFIRMSKAL